EKVNSGFDECKSILGTRSYGASAPVGNAPVSANQLKVSAFPNPYENNNFKLTINAPVSGEATIQLYNIDGLRISVIKRTIKQGHDEIVEITVPTLYKTRIVYYVTIGSYNKKGIVLSPN